ncbi:MAG: type II secretion system protein N [Chromatiales bacterium]
MNIYRLANGLTLILLLVCTLLVIVIYTEIQGTGIYNDMAHGNKENDQNIKSETSILNNISQTDVAISQFSEVLNRPLFAQGRMPYEEEKNENISLPVTSPLRLSLEGVVLSPDSQVAVVKDLSTNEILRLGIGMSHNGWRVKTIEPQAVEFERDGEVQTINIELANAPDDRSRNPRFKTPTQRNRQPAQSRR